MAHSGKRWIWIAVIMGVIVVGLIIWAVVSSKNAQKAADQQDIAATKADIQDPTLSQSLRDCRKSCRIICKANHSWILSGRTKCKNKCKDDCISGVDVVKNKSHY